MRPSRASAMDPDLRYSSRTEAGGEGRNFQFCHILVNYDLPWNPMKVEQRIGRVDRIGQKHPVKIFNFSTRGTIEERVVEVLTNRIGVFKETIGGLDPILGEVESDLKKIFMAAELERDREVERLGQRLEARVAEARRAEEHLADLIMDTRSYRKDEVEALLQRESPVKADDIRAFALGALTDLGVRISHDEAHPGVYELRFGSRFERLFPDEYRVGSERTVTFDLSTALEREEVDFLAFGHPIVDGLVARIDSKDAGGITSYRTVLTDEIPAVEGGSSYTPLSCVAWTRVVRCCRCSPRRMALSNRTSVLGCWTGPCQAGERTTTEPSFPPATPDSRRRSSPRRCASSARCSVGSRTRGLRRRAARRGAPQAERFYDYRAQAAADKVAANRRTLARLRESVEDETVASCPSGRRTLRQVRRSSRRSNRTVSKRSANWRITTTSRRNTSS